jgi:F0F1-type ATP synthase alpha subunit
MRIDLARPMAKGNLIIFKGERNQGKTSVAASTIKQFIKEAPENRVVYVGIHKQHGEKLLNSIEAGQRNQVLALTID